LRVWLKQAKWRSEKSADELVVVYQIIHPAQKKIQAGIVFQAAGGERTDRADPDGAKDTLL
jgi:hypothetical protein